MLLQCRLGVKDNMYTNFYRRYFNSNFFLIIIQISLIVPNIDLSYQQEIHAQENYNVENPQETDDTYEEVTFLDSAIKNQKEYYSLSPNKLIFLAELEQDLYSVLLDCIQSESESYELKHNELLADEIDIYLLDYKVSTKLQADELISGPLDRKKRAYGIASNPLMAYRMIRRFNSHISLIATYLSSAPLSCKWCRKLRSLIRGVKLPTMDDERDSVSSLLRIQTYHNFTSSDLSKGIFGSVKTAGRLSVVNVVEIGLFAKDVRNFVLAVEWLELGLSLIKQMNYFDGIEQYIKEVKEFISETKIEHDQFWDNANLYYREGFDLFKNKFSYPPNGDNSVEERVEKLRVIDEAIKYIDNFTVFPHTYETTDTVQSKLRYMTLCAGTKNYQTSEEKRQLRCWYERKKHPYWRINPLKMELLHPDPPLLQVYDIFGDHFIDEIMAEAAPMLQVAETVNVAMKRTEVNDYRTAVSTWIYDRSSNHMKSFYKKLKFFTGLKVDLDSDSESLQVAGYSFGGQYATHVDCLTTKALIDDDGERIATFMTYMNDVPAGGSTAFPYLGTAANPVKGSAVFWYDMLKNGSCDDRLTHGACPVVLGNKYVFNIWIRSKANFLQRPCDLDKKE